MQLEYSDYASALGACGPKEKLFRQSSWSVLWNTMEEGSKHPSAGVALPCQPCGGRGRVLLGDIGKGQIPIYALSD